MATNWTLCEPDIGGHDSIYYLALRHHNANKGYDDDLSPWLSVLTQNPCQGVLKTFGYAPFPSIWLPKEEDIVPS